MFIVMKENVSHNNGVAHQCVLNSFWTTVQLKVKME